MSEADIQRAIVAYLRTVLPSAIVTHVPNQVERAGTAAMREVKRKKDMGMLPGFPDILILADGRGYTIEVKAPGGSLGKAQRAVRDVLARQGIPFGVARSIDDARALLAEWGLSGREVANA